MKKPLAPAMVRGVFCYPTVKDRLLDGGRVVAELDRPRRRIGAERGGVAGDGTAGRLRHVDTVGAEAGLAGAAEAAGAALDRACGPGDWGRCRGRRWRRRWGRS